MVRLVLYRGRWYAAATKDGLTHRIALRTADRAVAERKIADLERRPEASGIAEAAEAHLVRTAHKASAAPMAHAWKALKPTFGNLRIDQITPELCATYGKRRKREGVTEGTIIKELGFLRSAVKRTAQGHLARFELPAQPPPRDRWIEEADFDRLLQATPDPHLRLFIIMAIATAARSGAILDLTWDRVDFDRRQIALGEAQEGRKRRAVVPMNQAAEGALRAAHEVRGASGYVVEYGGHKIKSIKKGFRAAVERAGLEDVSPHVLRHSAATWMTQKGVPIIEVARYLGHTDPKITYRVYAKHTPDYLRSAAAAIETKGGFFRTVEPDAVNGKGTERQGKRTRKTPRPTKSKG